MKDTKLPHFPFFARDWLTDERVMLMTLECQGAYLRLLCYQWLEGSIPDSPKKLASLCMTSLEHFEAEIWPDIGDAFNEIAVQRLQNPRLETIRVETEAKVAKAIENGKRGAAKRWKDNQDSDPNSPPLATQSDPNAIHNHNHSQIQDDDDGSSLISKSGELTQETAEVYERLMFTFRFGHLKALNITETLGTTMEDLDDWGRYENAKGTRLTCHHMKMYKNPRDIPEEKQGTESSSKRKTFAQIDEEEYAKKKADFDKEQGENDVSGNSESA